MEETKKIYIGNLEYGVSESDISGLLEAQGLNATEIRLIKDKYTDRPKGFGFAEFATEEDAQKAIDSLNDKDLNGRKMKVSKAQKMKPRREFTGGAGRGGYSGGGRNFRY